MEQPIANLNIGADQIIAFENGELDVDQQLELLAELVCSGLAWLLRASIYGRPAAGLIAWGFLSPKGEVLKRPSEIEFQLAIFDPYFYKRPGQIRNQLIQKNGAKNGS